MSWNTDSELDSVIERIASRALEEALVQEEQHIQADIALLKSQGRRLDNRADLQIAWQNREDRAASTVQAAGRRLIGEAVDALQRTYGGIPPDALSWLHDRLPPHFDRAASDYVAHLALRAGDAMVDRVRARMRRVTAALRRDLEIELAPVEFSARLNAIAAGNLPSTASATRDVDAFISHASEDKSEVARPLAAALIERELTVWLDEMELVVGRSLYRTIEDGLQRCRFGVVILSPSFFSKDWPRRELSALAALSDAEGRDKILPVWHKVDFAAVARASPLLADVYAAKTADGLAHVADAISVAIARGVKTL